MSTCQCVSYFRSRKKDGSHAIQSAVADNPTLHTHFTTVCVYRCRVIDDGKVNVHGSG